MLSSEVSDEQKEDMDAKKKKDDDYDPNTLYVMGLVELEIQLLPLEEAEADPVGKRRKEPNHVSCSILDCFNKEFRVLI